MTDARIRSKLRHGRREIRLDRKPDLEPGQVVVLRHDRARQPRRWAVVVWVRQSKPGEWTVRVRHHEVEQPRLLRAGPLPYTDHDRARRDRVHPPGPDEIAQAREESHYRTSKDVLDAGDGVSDEWLRKFSHEGRARRGAMIAEAIRG